MASDDEWERDRPPLARDDTVMFVEADDDGMRQLVGVTDGNFPAPLEISTQAEALLTMMVDVEEVPLGAKVGVIQILGRGPNKQVTVHCEVDETVTREDFAHDTEVVTAELAGIRED